MTHGSLFSGIGGFDLAAEWAGWENKFHCEFNDFGSQVLKYYWPNATSYKDITTTDFTIWRGRIDVLTGGFPCQPFSNAGKRGGTEDNRFLWPQMLRAIREIKPSWIVAENVPGILTIENGLVFEQVCVDLENEGYEVQPVIIPAVATDADHRRDRVWFIAYNISFRGREEASGILDLDGHILPESRRDQSSVRCTPLCGEATTNTPGERCRETWICISRYKERTTGADADNNKQYGHYGGFRSSEIPQQQAPAIQRCFPSYTLDERLQRNQQQRAPISRTRAPRSATQRTENEHWLEAATRLCVLDDGLPGRLDGITVSKWRTESIKAAGNAIVPQVAFEIFKAINDFTV